MKTIVFLEGESGTDYFKAESAFKKKGYNVIIVDELYENPENLEKVREISPDYLFVGTTGMFIDKRNVLKAKFRDLNYVPKAVIFFNETTVHAYHDIASELKALGTKFYWYLDLDQDFKEVSWV